MKLNADMTVQELIARHPGAVRYFLGHRMLCVGCPTEAFHTLAEVAGIHGLDTARLIEGIARSIAATEMSSPSEDD